MSNVYTQKVAEEKKSFADKMQDKMKLLENDLSAQRPEVEEEEVAKLLKRHKLLEHQVFCFGLLVYTIGTKNHTRKGHTWKANDHTPAQP